MRCLTLAVQLKTQGIDVNFISRSLPGNLNEFMIRKGWTVYTLPFRPEANCRPDKVLQHEDWLGEHWELDCEQTLAILNAQAKVDWLIVDHYALDYRWEKILRPVVGQIMVIDDLADRVHDCDLLLDQNLQKNMTVRYKDLVPEHCQPLLGPRYAMLRPEFSMKRKRLRCRTGELQRVLVFFGGSDPFDVTGMAVRAFQSMNLTDLVFDIVIGGSNPNRERIRELCRNSPNFHYHCQVDDMAGIIERADLAFGAAGSSIWERLCLGLPTIVVSVAGNQDMLLKGVLDKDLLIYMGNIESVREEHFKQALNQAMNDEGKQTMLRISAAALEIVDGMGCERVLSAILEYTKEQID